MQKISKQHNTQENNLFNSILLLSRNSIFYTKFDLIDTFQNRIYLIFIHVSFLFIKIKQNQENKKHKIFHQKIFDLIFNKIEVNMREIGYGDVTINKNMKLLVKSFYNILLKCEKYAEKSLKSKNTFFSKYLVQNINRKKPNYNLIIKYFDNYQTFCFDLSSDSVLKGDLNFNYK